MRTELKGIQTRFDADAKLKALVEQAGALDKKMAPVEEQLIQVNMKGSEANLAFPNMLNEQLDGLAGIVQAGDSAPSAQQYEVFKMLRGKLDQQLAAWKQIMSTDVPAFNQLVHSSDVPALYLPPTGD
jgi:hypothetical protein